MVGKRTILINGKEVPIRSYEVSIWSLQDSFITVLKWANLENKGLIQEPNLVLDVDGTETFKFSIPMYLNGKENPIWYNTLNGNLMMGLRKIKVILNKLLEDEEVFEFLIVKVTEKHEATGLFCDVECEGLAFHELGKIGYKIDFSGDTFLLDLEKWFNKGLPAPELLETLDYWNLKTDFLLPYLEDDPEFIPVPNKWYYKVEMNWNSYNSNQLRLSTKVYDDEYVSSWQVESNALVPRMTAPVKEKEHAVEIKESNIYNITQKIAEAFGVFCRYKYTHDDNYHITSRQVIYYNNFIEELSGHMDLTYPYHTSEITREMDSTEVITKLFVRPADYEINESNEVTIMSVDANRSGEDYILNFDYLHKFNIITDEQYEEVGKYEAKLKFVNSILASLTPLQINILNRITNYEAKLAVAKNGEEEAAKLIDIAANQINALSGGDGIVHITYKAPKSLIVLSDKNNSDHPYYVQMPISGIIPSTVKLYDGILNYTKENWLEHDDAVLVTGGKMVFDSVANDLIKIIELPNTVLKKKAKPASNNLNEGLQSLNNEQSEEEWETVDLAKSLWLVCDYAPHTYWEKVRDYWLDRLAEITKTATDIETNILPKLKTRRTAIENRIDELTDLKKEYIKEFEEMMGPALREGYWQPEDYNDYGDRYLVSIGENLGSYTEGKLSYNSVDDTYYDGNNKITYYEGEVEKTHLVIKVTSAADANVSTIMNMINTNYSDLYFVYYDAQSLSQYIAVKDDEQLPNDKKNTYLRNAKRYIKIGGDNCRFAYIETSNKESKFLGLVLTDTILLDEAQLNFFRRSNTPYSESDYNNYESKIGKLTFDANGEAVLDSNNILTISTDDYFNSGIEEIYRRITIDSVVLNTSEETLKIRLGDNVLEKYTDYEVYIDTDLSNPNDLSAHDKYIIDIKPEAVIKTGKYDPAISIMYTLSNADVLIYLDALLVAKENSEPKVSYTISLNIYDPLIIHNIYKKLSKIVHINDVLLKFENVLGYISHIEMNLDKPWEDSIEIKNYKTKFEDLFSNIVAQTDAMLKKSASYDVAALAFGSDGGLTSSTITKMLSDNELLFNTYIDKHIIQNDSLRTLLTDVFNEAGLILSSAGSALVDLKSLNEANADILAGFVRGADEGFSKGIDLVSSVAGEYTSAVLINKNGIFLGSNQHVALYSGTIDDDKKGATIDLSPQRLILGVSSNNSASVVKLTDDYLVLAAGNAVVDSLNTEIDLDNLTVTGEIDKLVGMKLTKDTLGLATLSSGNVINTILMNGRGVTLGSAIYDSNYATNANANTGINLDQDTATLKLLNVNGASFVRIAGNGVYIGSGGELYVDTNNIFIDSSRTETNNIFELKKKASDWTELNNKYDNALSYNITNGLTINGRISAESLIIEDNSETQLSKWVNAKVTPSAIWLGVKSATAETGLKLEDNKITISSSSNGSLIVNTSNVVIDTTATGDNAIFRIGGTGDNYKLLYTSSGLKIKGEVTADGGSIGGWDIDSNLLSSGTTNTYVGLDSNVNNTYAIWAGDSSGASADFRVKRNGLVYLHKLMVLDTRPNEANAKWGLGGSDSDHDSVHLGIATNDEDPNLYYGYKAIDFSKLNFKLAVSVNGAWNGGSFEVNVSLWGVLNKKTSMSASVTVTSISAGTLTGSDTCIATVYMDHTINGSTVATSASGIRLSAPLIYLNGITTGETNKEPKSLSYVSYNAPQSCVILVTSNDGTTKNLSCNALPSYDKGYTAGWNAALDACTGEEVLVNYSNVGNYTLYKGNYPSAPSAGTGYWRLGGSTTTRYSLPDRK